MTYHHHSTLPTELLESIAEQGLDAIPELIRTLLNQAMLMERQKYLNAAPYERTAERQGYANGFKPKTVATRMGKITFDVPQVRHGEFYPNALEKGLRSERALKLALAEMYIQGVSTRNVAAITEKLCGFEVSSTQVSQAVAMLDAQLEAWRTRPLGRYPYLYLDARYESVRQDGLVQDAAVLIAVGVNPEGKREVLGVSVALSEAEIHWRTFMQQLVARGLSGVQLIISDAHTGLKQARQAVFGGVPWQRCQFHLQQNAQAYITRQEQKTEVAAAIRAIFNAPNRIEAEALLRKTVTKYAQTAPRLASWLEENIPEGLTVFNFPEEQRQRLRTTNGLERLNREIARRSRIVVVFPNEASCLRLVTALLMETSEEWLASKKYLTWTDT
jgi:putative transposase